MTATPTISVLVPVYNRAQLLAACLDSILAQTWSDFEVVVVDGASTDTTWDVCLDYASREPRIRAIREDANGGPVAGWQRCLSEARGTLGTFLWSDDLFRPAFLESLAPLMTPDTAFAFCAAEIGETPGQGSIHYRHARGRLPASEFVAQALAGKSDLPVSPACALFRLEDLRAALTAQIPTRPPTDLSWTGAGTDVLFYLLTARKYAYIACEAEALAFFRSHPGSITVEGGGGRVAKHYAITRAWYARAWGQPRLAATLIAREWLRTVALSRTWISPQRASRDYGAIVPPSALLLAAVVVAARRVASSVVGRLNGVTTP